jgi:hypothetical protein
VAWRTELAAAAAVDRRQRGVADRRRCGRVEEGAGKGEDRLGGVSGRGEVGFAIARH